MRNRKHRNRGLANRIFNFNQQRVLVMDDEAAIRDLTSELLATLGYEVTTVPDGVEALRTYEDAMRSGQIFRRLFWMRRFAAAWAALQPSSACAISIRT